MGWSFTHQWESLKYYEHNQETISGPGLVSRGWNDGGVNLCNFVRILWTKEVGERIWDKGNIGYELRKSACGPKIDVFRERIWCNSNGCRLI